MSAPPPGGFGGASPHHNWRYPSAANKQKYGLIDLGDDFVPTSAEQRLLDMYDTVRVYERTAAQLQQAAARAKLSARENEFQQKQQQVNNKRKRQANAGSKKSAAAAGSEDDDDDQGFAAKYDSSDGEDDNPDAAAAVPVLDANELARRREEKLAELRHDVETAKMTSREAVEEARRLELLGNNTNSIDVFGKQSAAGAAAAAAEAPRLTKKQRLEYDEHAMEGPLLIANLAVAVTPPHDFSKTLERKGGQVLFPTNKTDVKWTPPPDASQPNEDAFVAHLTNFDMAQAQHGAAGGPNTFAIKFMAPSDAKRFSLNVATPSDWRHDFDSVLFHFNPRQHERGGQVVLNDKQDGIWGQAIAIPTSQVPVMFGQTACTLLVQVTGEGFDVILQGEHIARLEHRKEIGHDVQELVLQFPSTDDYGSPENWAVYQVWWGHMEPLAKGDVSHVAGVNSFSSLHPRKLFVSGLAKISTSAEVDMRRAELERAFRKYGGERGVSVVVPTHTTYAFVECESERQCDLALREMATQYRLNRARRSKHEALQEERAAAEAVARGETVRVQSEPSTWD